MDRTHPLAPVVLAAVTALALAGPARAQVKPFKITGVGVGTRGLPLPGQDPRPHWVIGEATHLGRHYGEGTIRTDSVNFEHLDEGIITGQFGAGSPFTFYGANGEKLVTWYGRTDHGATKPGSYTLTIVDFDAASGMPIVEAEFIAEFVVVPDQSTGKFAGATGSWVMYALTEPFVLGSDDPVGYWWDGQGKLTFRPGRQ
jgi:hypothetical protein